MITIVATCFGWAAESKALAAKMLFASDVTNQPSNQLVGRKQRQEPKMGANIGGNV